MNDEQLVWCPLCSVFHEHAPDVAKRLADAQSKLQDRERQLEGALGVGIERGREIKDLQSRLDAATEQLAEFRRAQTKERYGDIAHMEKTAKVISDLHSRLSSFLLPWRSELPSECGYYWHRPSFEDNDIVSLKGVQSYERADHRPMFFVDHAVNTVASIGGEWCGPIPMPERTPVVEKPLPVAPRERPPIEPDADGDCKRCGLGWSIEEIEGADKHECPPGFLV